MPRPGLLNAEQRGELLRVARGALCARLAGDPMPVTDTTDVALTGPGAAFVTLRRRTESGEPSLRGCIGTFEQDTPLLDVVARMAESAALSDPRFPSVVLEELQDLVIEISVLSPRVEIDPQQVVVGLHGLYLSRGTTRGVLLPQVAVEYGWDRETFLDQTCRKAGLDAGSWRHPDTRIEVFTAEVFGES